jgi:hypothetical protein
MSGQGFLQSCDLHGPLLGDHLSLQVVATALEHLFRCTSDQFRGIGRLYAVINNE